MSSPRDVTIIARALLESSLSGCSSPEGCGSISDSESELSKARLIQFKIENHKKCKCFLI